ncbi:hypothetical protein RHRU231_660003 [Rhodococcus ruber]|uniref:Uncharacterized protein n=1 Tax=Rhodococcus ruber TaxID=1830 RepID=A0A098BPI7_9NOCA|nr:hypothetical protein YT1_0242 [Rhodococcus ruber]CCW11898.1 hypothetical protein EBESD8_24420 [Rhodococcus aetherivorans]CDZ90157.1 hypothetical protein RHRU231_660003 [Rhodococcus ruber]
MVHRSRARADWCRPCGRGGTLAYFAAYDAHGGQVLGTIAPKTGIAWFAELVEKVMTTEPYASGHAGVLGRRQRLVPQRDPFG